MKNGQTARATSTGGQGAAAAERWSRPPAHLRRAGRSWIPSVFVVFSLLALLAIPVWLEHRISTVRADALEPAQNARGVFNDVRQAFSEAEASYRGYLLTGDDRLRQSMLAAHAAEAAGFDELRRYALHFDASMIRQIDRMRALSLQAQQRRIESLDRSAETAAIAMDAHARLLDESMILRRAIAEQLAGSRARLRTLQRTGVLIMMGLGVLALSAAVLVIITAHRDRRRALLEAELRAAALTLAEATEIEDILSRVVASAARTVRGASCFVERIDEERHEITVVSAAGSCVLSPGTRVPFPGSLTEAALASGSPEQFHVRSMADRPSSAQLKDVCEHCAGVVVPLISDLDPLGALVLLRPGSRQFSAREVLQLRIFGVFAALALRKGMLLARAVEQQNELQRAAMTRERMVRGFSHDLKNPLGAADGHAALLQEGIVGELTDAQHEHVSGVRRGLASALEIIEDVVELASAEAGHLAIRRSGVEPASAVSAIVRQYSATAAAAGVELVQEVPEKLPSIHTDPRRVQQILGNLVLNAIKYTPEGGRVRVSAAERPRRRSPDSPRWVLFAVEDTGRGIAEEDLPRLFQEFQRLDPGDVPGAGLGLAISDRIARLLGGEIQVQSEIGKGSTFTFCLPVEPESARDTAAPRGLSSAHSAL